MLSFASNLFYFLFIETARTDRQVERALAEVDQLQAVVEAGEREVYEGEEELLALIRRERAIRARRRAERQASAKPYKKDKA